MKTISYWIRGYFGFSQKEASGFIILSSLTIISLFAPLIYNKLSPAGSDTGLSDQKMLEAMILEIEEGKNSGTESQNPAAVALKTQKSDLFMFDPNIASLSDLKKLGIKQYMAERIVKYRDKGGKFRVKNDLNKIYGFSADHFQELKAFILLPDSMMKAERKIPPKKPVCSAFDINTADTMQLNRLKGIANVMSARIIKYRDKLGGFISVSQFAEVYSISPLALDELGKRTFIKDNFIPLKLNINTSEFNVLSPHPYIGKKLAAILVNYRSQHGRFTNADDLKQIIGISPEQIEKLKPYLCF